MESGLPLKFPAIHTVNNDKGKESVSSGGTQVTHPAHPLREEEYHTAENDEGDEDMVTSAAQPPPKDGDSMGVGRSRRPDARRRRPVNIGVKLQQMLKIKEDPHLEHAEVQRAEKSRTELAHSVRRGRSKVRSSKEMRSWRNSKDEGGRGVGGGEGLYRVGSRDGSGKSSR